MERTGEIYKISWDGGCYIGKTICNSFGRWLSHVRLLKKNIHHNKTMQGAFDSVGILGMCFSILESDVKQEFLAEREQYWTKIYSGCNRDLAAQKKEQTRELVLLHLKRGIKTYREIAQSCGVSLGYISYTKHNFLN